MNKHCDILILGGGTAGIMTAAQLQKQHEKFSVIIVEPSEKHYYQPAYTLVGAGTYKLKDCIRPEADYIPPGVEWVKDYAEKIDPHQQLVYLKNGDTISYQALVIATGITYDFSLIEGLKEALDKGVACSNYLDPEKTWELLKQFKGGNAIFTQPSTPIKCGGAPQKAAYISADYLRKKGLANKTNIVLAMPGSVIFGVKPVAESLLKKVKEYNIQLMLGLSPVKIDAENKKIYFKIVIPDAFKISEEARQKISMSIENEMVEMPFDFLHLAPPQTTHAFLKESGLTNAQGWVDVNINSLQHNVYPNIFSLGDAAALPTAKTGAAIRKQVPVLIDNLISYLKQKQVNNYSYQGYSSCPLVTGYNEMVLAEFNYKNEFTPDPKLKQMLVFNSAKPHWRLWILKKYILPHLYWNKMLKGIKV